MLAAMGSTITAATSSWCSSKILFTESRSLYGATIVSDVAPFVTPAESGMPNVAIPEPPLTSIESECPW